MQRRVEIYVRTEKVAFDKGRRQQTEPEHYCTIGREGRCIGGCFAEAQQTLIETLKELCDGAKTELRIYDVQNFKGRLRARLQRVKIPTIISGTVDREQVQFLLK